MFSCTAQILKTTYNAKPAGIADQTSALDDNAVTDLKTECITSVPPGVARLQVVDPTVVAVASSRRNLLRLRNGGWKPPLH